MKPRWIVLIVTLVIAVGAVAYFSRRPAAHVEVINPRIQTLRAYVDEQAITELPRDYLVAMPIAGWLQPIELREGDPAKKDQVVARLETEDLADQVRQTEHQIGALEVKIRQTQDNRLENNMLIQALAMVKSFDDTVKAAEEKANASQAVAEFARSEAERLNKLRASGAASEVEVRAQETQARQAEAQHKSDLLQSAALKTLAAVSYIGPKFITDYIDRKSFDRESYQQQLEEAKARLEIEKRNLARAEMSSPIDGVVLQRHQTRRQFLSAGTPLLTIGRLEDMEVAAEVLTERATRIAPGNAVDITGDAILNGSIPGKVTRVYPAGFKKISSLGVEQQRVKVTIKPEQRPERLGVEFRVLVRIYYAEAPNALTLPRTALFRGETGEWQVMVVRDGVTHLQTVSVGLMNDEEAQIAAGISANDAIVAKPSSDIVPGMRVSRLNSH